MKQNLVKLLSIFTVVASVGWYLANRPKTSVGLGEVSLIQQSEHSHQGSTIELAGFRFRLSPDDFNYEIQPGAQAVPKIPLAVN